MIYRAKLAYQDRQVAESYNQLRFKSAKGKLTNFFELRKIYKALKQANIQPPALVLDIPSGPGRLSIHLLKRGYKLVAADISSIMLSQIKKINKKDDFKDQLMLVVADAESLCFDEDVFDAVICLRLLGHIPPNIRLNILKELRRVTKKYLILAYYDNQCLQHFLRKKKRRGNEWYSATEAGIKDEFFKANLIIEKVFPLLKKISETLIILARKKEKQ